MIFRFRSPLPLPVVKASAPNSKGNAPPSDTNQTNGYISLLTMRLWDFDREI